MVRQLVPLPGRGVSLEIDIHEAHAPASLEGPTVAGGAPQRPWLLVLHPLSWLGGSMDDHIVIAVCRAALATGGFSAVVRYNMRGTGASTGSRSLHASVDSADLVALARHLLQRQQPLKGSSPSPAFAEAGPTAGTSPLFAGQAASGSPPDTPGPQRRLAVVAYSYGCLVAARALPELHQHLVALATVAFPLGVVSRIFLCAGTAWDCFAGPKAPRELPRLLCLGDMDQFSDCQQVRTAVEKAQRGEAKAAAAAAAKAAAKCVADGPGGSSPAPYPAWSTPTSPASGSLPSSASAPDAMPAGSTASASGPSASSVDSTHGVRLVVWPCCDHFFVDAWDISALVAAGLMPPTQGLSAQARGQDGCDGAEGKGVRDKHVDLTVPEALARIVVRWLLQHAAVSLGGPGRKGSGPER